jgi:DNA-binding transcriptional ArsR family regulator
MSTSPADRQLAALADPSRRAIFEQLVKQPLSVGALAGRFPISRPAVSQHLRVLKEARLVQHERIGTQHVYRVDPAGIVALRRYLDAMWSRALGDFKRVAEASYRRARKERP